VKIIVPMVPLSMNQQKAIHFHDYKKTRDAWQRTIFALFTWQQKKKLAEWVKAGTKVMVKIHIERPRLLDPDGIAVKEILDSLVRLELLGGDSSEYIDLPQPTQEKSRQRRTTIEIIPVETGEAK